MYLIIGDIEATAEPTVLETSLGSCVTTCIYDPVRGVGGMNHYMLPHLYVEDAKDPGMCAPAAIDLLVERVQRAGGFQPDLRAKLFGGGRVVEALAELLDIGAENLRVARERLAHHGIPITAEFTGQEYPLKVRFESHTGRAFLKLIKPEADTWLPAR